MRAFSLFFAGALLVSGLSFGAEPPVFEGRRIGTGTYEAAAIFDVNNDGVLDLFSGGFWYPGPGFDRAVKACEPMYQDTYYDDFSNYPMDVNGDGFMDLAVGNNAIPNELYLNDGRGQFRKVNAGFFGERAVNTCDLTALDVNMDGVPDIVSANVWEPNDMYVGVREESPVVLAP
ncbi:MAG TPA: VCBS repeat-containing protein, partial [Candidatus Hydrogenedentes bacterium]|nr:VCBS repeat-containing protein [Candidatus Hydrogenedentota bacterium]